MLRASPHIDMESEQAGGNVPKRQGSPSRARAEKSLYETARSNPSSRTWLELPQVGSDIIVSYHAYHGDICVGFGLVKLYGCDSQEM